MRRSGYGFQVASFLAVAAFTAIAAGPLSGQAGGQITLDEAVRLALSSNRELETAYAELAGAEGQVREAWSSVYPTINATAAYTRNLEVPGQFLPAQIFDPSAAPGELILMRFGTDNMWNGQLRLEQPVFEAAAFIGVGAAARYRGLQEEVVRGRAQEVVTRTKQRYFDVLLAEEAERLSGESVRRVRQALEETKAMHRAGLLGDYDVLRLEVELANLEPALRRATNAAEAARRTLAIELGLEAVPVDVRGSLAAVSLAGGEAEADPLLASFGLRLQETGDLPGLVARARSSRSDVRQVELTEQLRQAELRAEQSGYLPRISLFATYAYSAQADGGINPFGWGGSSSMTHPQIGLQVSIPVFDGFRRPARSDQIRSTLAQTRTQGRLVAAQVENQVKTLYDQVEEARLRAVGQEAAVAQARRGYEIASAQFREGISTRLELTDAEVALRQSEFNLAEAVHDYLSARAQLDHAVGAVPGVR